MAEALAQKKGDPWNDAGIVYYKLKNEPMTATALFTECSFPKEQSGKFENSKERLEAALKLLKNGGYIKEGEKVKAGVFKKEPVLSVVKELPAEAPKKEFAGGKLA
jgi:hypothetical protein